MLKRKSIIALITGLLFIAAQLVSIAHAAEHPFHDASEICASFICLEQQDAAAPAAFADAIPCYTDDYEIGYELPVYLPGLYTNPARAPPLTA